MVVRADVSPGAVHHFDMRRQRELRSQHPVADVASKLTVLVAEGLIFVPSRIVVALDVHVQILAGMAKKEVVAVFSRLLILHLPCNERFTANRTGVLSRLVDSLPVVEQLPPGMDQLVTLHTLEHFEALAALRDGHHLGFATFSFEAVFYFLVLGVCCSMSFHVTPAKTYKVIVIWCRDEFLTEYLHLNKRRFTYVTHMDPGSMNRFVENFFSLGPLVNG